MPYAAPPAGDIPSGGPPLTAKSKEEFAACLRALRTQAGTPSFRQLAKITHYSPSTLAEATAGRRLPTEAVVTALVTACGADPAPWREQLGRLATAEQRGRLDATPGRATSGPDADAAPEPDPNSARWPAGRRRPVVVGAGGVAILAVGLAIGWASGSAMSARSASTADESMKLPGVPVFSGIPEPASTARVSDGTDPIAGGCKADRQLVDQAPVTLGSVQVGALDLWYSPRCGAGWADLYLTPGEPLMMGEVTVRSRDDRFSTISNPLVNQTDDYTDVIVPGPGGCLGAGAAVYESGKSIMTAVIPCEMPATAVS
ncbi:MAG TPA: helix-turn-helix domain-containing protein [Trebonia sp.]|nr:helix-turn-helix domain-containing protein [Trebonia sp.]